MQMNSVLSGQKIRPVIRDSFTDKSNNQTISYVQLQLETLDEANRVIITRVSCPVAFEPAAEFCEKNQGKLINLPVVVQGGDKGSLKFRIDGMPELAG